MRRAPSPGGSPPRCDSSIGSWSFPTCSAKPERASTPYSATRRGRPCNRTRWSSSRTSIRSTVPTASRKRFNGRRPISPTHRWSEAGSTTTAASRARRTGRSTPEIRSAIHAGRTRVGIASRSPEAARPVIFTIIGAPPDCALTASVIQPTRLHTVVKARRIPTSCSSKPRTLCSDRRDRPSTPTAPPGRNDGAAGSGSSYPRACTRTTGRAPCATCSSGAAAGSGCSASRTATPSFRSTEATSSTPSSSRRAAPPPPSAPPSCAATSTTGRAPRTSPRPTPSRRSDSSARRASPCSRSSRGATWRSWRRSTRVLCCWATTAPIAGVSATHRAIST